MDGRMDTEDLLYIYTMDGWIEKICYIYTMGYYSTVRIKEIL